jgi:uncharacterized protein YdiU (UPF0061 family)
MAKTLLNAMADGEADFTLVFRHLSDALESGDDQPVIRLFNSSGAIVEWLAAWRVRLSEVDSGEALTLMRRSNPVYIPRNHRIEEAIAAGNAGDFATFHRLNDALQHPFESQPEFSEYEAAPEPDEVVHATFCGT